MFLWFRKLVGLLAEVVVGVETERVRARGHPDAHSTKFLFFLLHMTPFILSPWSGHKVVTSFTPLSARHTLRAYGKSTAAY